MLNINKCKPYVEIYRIRDMTCIYSSRLQQELKSYRIDDKINLELTKKFRVSSKQSRPKLYNEESDLDEYIDKLQLSNLEPVLLKTRSNFESNYNKKLMKTNNFEAEIVRSEEYIDNKFNQINEKVIELLTPK